MILISWVLSINSFYMLVSYNCEDSSVETCLARHIKGALPLRRIKNTTENGVWHIFQH